MVKRNPLLQSDSTTLILIFFHFHLRCSKSMDEFFAWVDQNRKDIEAHSDWIDEQYTQFEDYIIHPELKDYERLCQSAAKGQWEDVLDLCHKEMFLSTVPITNSWDTVFHLATSDGRKDIFEKLLQLLPQESTHIASALRRKNKKGNNPLHIAASVGSVMMCRLIIRISKSMISTCNNEGETPLFVAALNGKNEAFLYLNSECGSKEKYCIRRNGDTILHCAIAEEHFGEHFDAFFYLFIFKQHTFLGMIKLSNSFLFFIFYYFFVNINPT